MDSSGIPNIKGKQQVLSKSEVDALGGLEGGNVTNLISTISKNPGILKDKFGLNDDQAQNVEAILVGSGTAASVKYLGKHFGDEISAIIGAGVSAYVAKKMFGSNRQ